MKRTGYIYALCTPKGSVYYVGRTVQSPGIRLGEHRREATTRNRQSACHKFTRYLIDSGAGPAVWVLERDVPVSKLNDRERHWIAFYKAEGVEILNYTGGGNGGLTMDAKQRERQARIAAKQPRDLLQRFLSPLENWQEAMAAGDPVPW